MVRPARSNTARATPAARKALDPESIRLAERLRVFRGLAGLRQNELAKLAKISPQRLSKYENAQQRIDAVTLFKLVTALQITPNHFYCDEAEEPVAGQDKSYWVTLQETSTSNLIRSLLQLTEEQKAAVRAVVGALNRASTRPSNL